MAGGNPFVGGKGVFTASDPGSALRAHPPPTWAAVMPQYLTPAIAQAYRNAGIALVVWEPQASQAGVDAVRQYGAAGYIAQAEGPAQLAAANAVAGQVGVPKALVSNNFMPQYPPGWVAMPEAYTNNNPNATADQVTRDAMSRGATQVVPIIGTGFVDTAGGQMLGSADYQRSLDAAGAAGAVGSGAYISDQMSDADLAAFTGGRTPAGASRAAPPGGPPTSVPPTDPNRPPPPTPYHPVPVSTPNFGSAAQAQANPAFGGVTNVRTLPNGATVTTYADGRQVEQARGKSAYVIHQGSTPPPPNPNAMPQPGAPPAPPYGTPQTQHPIAPPGTPQVNSGVGLPQHPIAPPAGQLSPRQLVNPYAPEPQSTQQVNPYAPLPQRPISDVNPYAPVPHQPGVGVLQTPGMRSPYLTAEAIKRFLQPGLYLDASQPPPPPYQYGHYGA